MTRGMYGLTPRDGRSPSVPGQPPKPTPRVECTVIPGDAGRDAVLDFTVKIGPQTMTVRAALQRGIMRWEPQDEWPTFDASALQELYPNAVSVWSP